MEYLLIGVIGFVVGWWVREQLIILNIIRNADFIMEALAKVKKLQEEAEHLEQTETADGVEVEVEIQSGQVYAWLKSNHQFLAQGATVEEAFKRAQERFPNLKFWYKKPEQNNQSA
jgi:hypothetical protein